MRSDNQSNTQITGQEGDGSNETKSDLISFWQHQLSGIKRKAEDLERSTSDGEA